MSRIVPHTPSKRSSSPANASINLWPYAVVNMIIEAKMTKNPILNAKTPVTLLVLIRALIKVASRYGHKRKPPTEAGKKYQINEGLSNGFSL